MFGYSESEMVGRHIHLLIPEDRWGEEEMIISHLKAGKRIEHYQTIRVTKSGRLINVSITVSPIKNAKGIIVGASKIARDITRQKEQEEIIRQYAERLELINAVGKSISSQLDEQSILQKVTDATTQLSGAAFGAFFYNKVDAKGETYMLYNLSGAPREAFEHFGMPRNTDVFAATFQGSGIVRSPDITRDPRYGKNSPHHGMPAGHLPVVSYLAVPVISSSGIVLGGLFFGHPREDMFKEEHEHLVAAIASQAAVALDNAKLYQEVQALSSRKDEFIGFASHELKTPLTTLSGYFQLAKKTPQLPAGFFDKVDKQLARLQHIISDLLDISKIQAGRMDLHFAKSSLNLLIYESVEAINPATHTIKTQLLHDDILITVDAQKMSQVLINLLANAIKYSEPGTTILVTASVLGDQVQISICDEGVGIASHDIDKIFNQFYRTSRTRSTHGLGLGLYIAREIMEGHMGKVWAESQEGKGSVFHVMFPVERIRAHTANK